MITFSIRQEVIYFHAVCYNVSLRILATAKLE